MPPIKIPEQAKEASSGCVLRLGKSNNVVTWNEELKSTVGALYGSTANFLQTNIRYVQPLPVEADYLPPVEEGGAAITVALTTKLREGAYEGRRRAVAQQKVDEQKIWSIMWGKMSPASQSKVQESEGYEAALLARDCVLLWEFVRRTHLTHIYGDGDPMVQVNVQEQESRYADLRQADREYLSSFKLRFDNQVKANAGAGVAAITDSKRALDFICKLDPKRYRSMLAKMRNSALNMEENAYPQSLSAAYRIASGWINEDRGFNVPPDTHSAFIFENESTPPTEKSPTTKADKKTNLKAKKASNIVCYVCEATGHYARDCPNRKGKTVAFVVDHATDFSNDEEYDEAAYVTTNEAAMFTREDVLLDSQASVNVFCNADLITNIKPADKDITLQGVDAGAKGISICKEGEFRSLGKVYYSTKTAANILSYAVMVDSGNKISYDQPSDTFTLISKGDQETFAFKRKNAPGSEGRFYCCNMGERIRKSADRDCSREHEGVYQARGIRRGEGERYAG